MVWGAKGLFCMVSVWCLYGVRFSHSLTEQRQKCGAEPTGMCGCNSTAAFLYQVSGGGGDWKRLGGAGRMLGLRGSSGCNYCARQHRVLTDSCDVMRSARAVMTVAVNACAENDAKSDMI
jgi:hypothetical protein